MSDFGMFEADEATQDQPRLAARTAARKLEAAIDTVRNEFGRFLMGATGIDEFEDRWHLSKNDIRASVEPLVFPNTGTMRRIQNAMKADWKLAHPYKVAADSTDPASPGSPMANPTFNTDPGPLYGGPAANTGVVSNDTGLPPSNPTVPNMTDVGMADAVGQGRITSNYQRYALDHEEAGFGSMPTDDTERNLDTDETYHPSSGNLVPKPRWEEYKDEVDQNGPEKVQRDFTPGGDSGSDRHARRFRADDDSNPNVWQQAGPGGINQSAPKSAPSGSSDPEAFQSGESLGNLNVWQQAGPGGINREAASLVADIYSDFAQANGLRVASLDTLAAYADTGIAEADYRLLESMIIRAAEEAEESEEEPDEDDHEEPDADNEGDFSDGDEDNEDSENDESDDDDSDDDEDYDFGGGDEGDEAAGGDAGGEQFTVPKQAPQLPPQMMQEIPQDDAGGTAPVPPEVIDSLLGLPEGTIEQLLLEEAQNGQGGDDFGGDAPQAGGDDFFGEGGGDNTEPPRVAAREFWAAPDESKEELTERQKREQKDSLDTQHQRWLKEKAARRFWAADDDSESSDGDSSGGDGGGQQDPAAGGMDPSMMGQMGGGMMPPPGSASVAPPQPAMPLENQPAEDALLDTANQAIMQMIDRETAEYQQIIGPLSQALQAVQFAQQVEQSEHPMDVTPPQGSVNVDPSQAPGGAQNPQQQLARLVREAKTVRTLKNAARLIAKTYGINSKMLIEAMGRRQYEHVAEAFHILPPQARQTREVRAAWDHIGNMFAADNSMFNKDVWMRSLDNPGSRLPFDRPRLAGETWKNTPTMDRFEFPRAGETPEISDNMTINDLPQHQFKGVPKPKKNSRRQVADLGTKVQRWLQRQTETGLNMGGDAMADRYLNEHSNPKSQRGIDEVHEALGATPHAIPTEPPNPSVRIPKATNPVTKRGTRQVPLETLYLRHRVNGRHGVGYSLFPGPNGWDDHDALGVQVKWDEDPLTWGPKDNPDTEDAQYRTDKWPYNEVGYTHYDRKLYPLKDFDIVGTLPGNLDPDKHQDVFDPREFGASRTAKFVDDEYGGYHTRDDDDPEHVFTNPRDGEKYVVQHQNGTLFKPGDMLTNFRGDQHKLLGISKYPEGSSEGKLTINDPYGPAYYPKNYDAEIVPYTGDWNPDDDQDPFDPRLIGAGRTATWGEWEPTKEASFFTRRVPGWRWDDYLNGYISKESKAFTCSCGQKVAAPSYKTCDCGKIWNVYAIGDQHHLGSDTADMFIAREIPVRDNVIMANKKMAGAPERLGDKVRKHLADWTKYDGEDPVAKTYGKPKPPSTKVSQPPKDWAKRLPAGDPSKKGGTWTQPPIAPKNTPKQ